MGQTRGTKSYMTKELLATQRWHKEAWIKGLRDNDCGKRSLRRRTMGGKAVDEELNDKIVIR